MNKFGSRSARQLPFICIIISLSLDRIWEFDHSDVAITLGTGKQEPVVNVNIQYYSCVVMRQKEEE